MRQSKLFTKTRREAPKDEVSRNADLLIRAGFISKEMAGVYAYLPLGLRTLNKIINIIREEMNAVGGQELQMTALQDKAPWEASNRWSDTVVDNWFKTKLKNDTEVGLAFTHEEPLTRLMKDHVRSWRDLPLAVYQFQTKFRNETRAKSGIIRGREFLMKDLYSFNVDEKSHEDYYNRVKDAYVRIFERVGLGDKTYVTFASGGTFSKYSHEFQTLTSAGEDIIYVDKKRKIAINKEVLNDEVLTNLKLNKSELIEEKAVEVGNIFTLGTKYSDALGLNFKDKEGQSKSVYMGSYGIGPGRVMGTIVEVSSDDKGIVWPASVAPFSIHLIQLGTGENVVAKANEIYDTLSKKGIEVLFDDRDATAGEKFSDSDLIGIPKRVIISEKTLANDSFEIKDRNADKPYMVKISDFLSKL